MSFLLDPAFLIALALWLAILIFVLALCAAAAWGDEQNEQAHRDLEEQDRDQANGSPFYR